MGEREYVQVMLMQGGTRTVAWVDKVRGLAVGSKVTLRDLDGVWDVEAVYASQTLTQKDMDVQREGYATACPSLRQGGCGV